MLKPSLSLIDGDEGLFERFLLFFNVSGDDVLLFEEEDFVELHVLSFFFGGEFVVHFLSFFDDLLIVENFFHIFHENIVPHFFVENLPYSFLYFLKLEGFFKRIDQLVDISLLFRFLFIKFFNLLQVFLLCSFDGFKNGDHHILL